MIVPLILELLTVGLSLWNNKEKHKYIDKKMELEKAWYAEYNKPDDQRNNAVLDNIKHELRILAVAFTTAARTEGAGV